jgi:hypothetical protein
LPRLCRDCPCSSPHFRPKRMMRRRLTDDDRDRHSRHSKKANRREHYRSVHLESPQSKCQFQICELRAISVANLDRPHPGLICSREGICAGC